MAFQITVFTSNDLNSQRVMLELEKRSLGFRLVSLDLAPPQAFRDLENLTQDASLPQVFFNTRYIGGWSDLCNELALGVAYEEIAVTSRLDRLEAIVAQAKIVRLVPQKSLRNAHDNDNRHRPIHWPTNPQLAQISHDAKNDVPVDLPDGTRTSISDITKKLANSLPLSTTLKYKGLTYKKVFSGADFCTIVSKSLDISNDEAVLFGSRLENIGVICHIESSHNNIKHIHFKDDENDYYRLQCHVHPEILNSYRIWNRGCSVICTELVKRLTELYNQIELDSLVVADKHNTTSRLDYDKIRQHADYGCFAECVCELQKCDISGLVDAEMMAFGINLFRLLHKYTLSKLGWPKSEADWTFMLAQIKFEVGSHLFTLSEWLNGILRGPDSKVLSRLDKRRVYAVSKRDMRLHFALHVGTSAMATSTSLPFTYFSSRNIEPQLTVAAEMFCNDAMFVQLDIISRQIKLARCFEIYRCDFGKTDAEVLQSIRPFLSDVKQRVLDELFRPETKPPVISYTDPGLLSDTNIQAMTVNARPFDRESIVGEVKGMQGLLKRWKHADLPPNEKRRLAKVRSLNLLDTLPEERFDRITRMVQETLDVPVVFVTLVEHTRMWIKSAQWVGVNNPKVPPPKLRPTEVPREVSFCSHALLNPPNQVFIVPDAAVDDRFADNPVVAGPLQVRFYAGCPLDLPMDDGESVNIGALCIHDFKPRNLTKDQIELLRDFAMEVKQEILRNDLEGLNDKLSRNVILV